MSGLYRFMLFAADAAFQVSLCAASVCLQEAV